MTGTLFITHNLGECLRQGAQNFKWQHKTQPTPGKQIGHGVVVYVLVFSVMGVHVLPLSSDTLL